MYSNKPRKFIRISQSKGIYVAIIELFSCKFHNAPYSVIFSTLIS